MTDVAVTSPNPVFLNPAVQVEALADALKALGFSVNVHKARRFMTHPCCVVHCGPERHLRHVELIFAAPDTHENDWWFWRINPDDQITSEKIAPLSQVSNAADLISRTLPQVQDGSNGG